jgi:NDP-sugar pyrophosphorylase family protein
MKAFILAAGLGTRLKPLTDNKPKALVEINGTPLIELIINRLIRFGFNQIIVNVHHFADDIIKFLNEKNNFGIEIVISNEKDLLLDTGGGLKKTAWFFDDEKPFLVHNVDILSNIDLSVLYSSQNSLNSMITIAVQTRNSSRYFLFDEEKSLCGWRNEKSDETKITRDPIGKLTPFAFSGIHVIDPEVFNLMPDQKVFSIVDFYLALASKHRITYFDHSGSIFLDLGKKENLIRAEESINNETPGRKQRGI